MFQDSLLESSPALQRRSRWSLATAFTVQSAIAGVLILLPLIYSGVLPSSIATPTLAPAQYIAPQTQQPHPSSGGSGNARAAFRPTQVVPVVSSGLRLIDYNLRPSSNEVPDPSAPLGVGPAGNGSAPSGLFTDARPIPPVQPKRIVISHSLEAMLMNKVVPEYPGIAKIAGVQGDVKLHAIIAKDGTIQSLAIMSGPDMLRNAALSAVRQWRYRPYMLNGEAVEVETLITVSFKRF